MAEAQHAIDPPLTPQGNVYVDDGAAWRRLAGGAPSFDDVTCADWVARRHPRAAIAGPRFGPAGDDVQLWGKTETQAHRWLRTQLGWRGYEISRVPGSDRAVLT